MANLDNFIDNINFFSEMRLHSPNFITYFKGKQISSFTNAQNNKEFFLSSTTNIINRIHGSYIQKLVNSFNEDNKNKPIGNNQNNQENNQENNKNNQNNQEEDNEDEEDNEKDNEEENEEENEKDEDNEKDKLQNNIKKRNTEISDKKVDKIESKIDLSKVDISKVDVSKIDLSKVDLEQLSIDKKKEKLKELLELKKRVQKN